MTDVSLYYPNDYESDYMDSFYILGIPPFEGSDVELERLFVDDNQIPVYDWNEYEHDCLH